MLGLVRFKLGGENIQYFRRGNLVGDFATTQQSNRQGLHRHQWLGDAHSGATRAFPKSWVTPHPLGAFEFNKGGELGVVYHTGDFVVIERFLVSCANTQQSTTYVVL